MKRTPNGESNVTHATAIRHTGQPYGRGTRGAFQHRDARRMVRLPGRHRPVRKGSCHAFQRAVRTHRSRARSAGRAVAKPPAAALSAPRLRRTPETYT